jgi:hypothetical protein
MSALIDLRGTHGWRLCAHARRCAADRAVPVRTVLEVVADPQVTRSANDYGEGRFIYTRGDISVVVAPATRVVITVLWHTYDVWTTEEFRARSHSLAVGGTCTGSRGGSGQAPSGTVRSAA